MIDIINGFSTVFWSTMIVLSSIVALLHFFKKETILKRWKLNNFEVAFFSLPFAIFSSVVLLLCYAVDPRVAFGLSGGTLCCAVLIFFAILIKVIDFLQEWRCKLPRT